MTEKLNGFNNQDAKHLISTIAGAGTRVNEPVRKKTIKTINVTATELIASESSGTAVYRQPTSTGWEDTELEYTIWNDHPSRSIADGSVVLAFDVNGRWVAIPPGSDGGCYIAKVTSTITARSGSTPGSGVVDVVESSGGVFATDTPTGLDVYNAYTSSIAEDEYIIILEDRIESKWWAVPKGGAPESNRVRGNIKDLGSALTITFGDATGAGPFTLENIEGIDAAWAGAAEISITNPEKHKLWSDTTCTVRCEYNETSGDWEVYDSQADRVVHGVIRDVCTMKQYNWSGLENWTAGHVANWVTSVDMLGCDLSYSTCSESEIPVKTFDYVTFVEFDLATCSLNVDYCNLTTVAHDLPFVTDVELSPSGCKLEVTKCGSPTTEITMPYLVSVEVVGSYLQSETACGDTFNIIEFTTCP